MRSLIWTCLLLFSLSIVQAQQAIIDRCPSAGIEPRPVDFSPGGLIITAFDSEAMWVYDIARDTRYPLPQTRPCTTNCHLSSDANWLIYLDPETFVFGEMRVDGTLRRPLVSDASDVRWWNPETLLIWTSDHHAYLRPEGANSDPITRLDVTGVVSIQPNGYQALQLQRGESGFNRYLVHLDVEDDRSLFLTVDRPYFNAAAWSPNGQYLAYVGNGAYDTSSDMIGAEIYLASLSQAIPQQMTFFSSNYGAVRINGYAPDDLSWSPDGRKLAFWVMELTGHDPSVNVGEAVLHTLNIETREISRYCGYRTTEHTPETPRIIWSPDGSHLAFAGNVPGDDKGALLIAVDVETGRFTELSDGMFPVYGIPQLVAWGNVP